MKNYTVSYYNPITAWDTLSNFFNDTRDFFGRDDKSSIKIDVVNSDNGYTVTADLPGFKKEDIHLDIEDDVLTLKAERHSEYENEDKRNSYVRCERSYGSYVRTFDLTDIDADRIHAQYNDGVLTLDLPKKEVIAPTARHLEIE